MLNSFWRQFKSGTDIRGVASEGVESEKINLTDDVIRRIILGFCKFIEEKVGKKIEDMKISIGHDSRISADRIKNIAKEALKSVGVFVYDCSLSSTPAMFMTTIDINCDAAIQITASHHPFNRNGLKFFTKDGGLESKEIEAILTYAQEENYPCCMVEGKLEKIDYMKTYSNHLMKIIKDGVNAENYNLPLSCFKIVVDAGNGAGGFYATEVLEPLGADISGSQYLDPDGTFPNHIPNPENKAAIDSLSKAVLKAGADLGVIFDTDVDRGAAVESNGNTISRNRLIALASTIAMEGNQGATIVTDSITSNGLTDFIEKELHGKHRRFKRGYRNVINEAIRLNESGINCPLAIETSGHAAFRDNYFLDDGAYLVTKIIINMVKLRKDGKNLGDVLKQLHEPKESIEVRLPIKGNNIQTIGENIINRLKVRAGLKEGWSVVSNNVEGIRVDIDKKHGNGWFLLRLSVHDPIMPLNVESDDYGGTVKILFDIYKLLLDEKDVDLREIEKLINYNNK